MGASPEEALDGIRLLMLATDLCLGRLMPDCLAKGLGFVQCKSVIAFSPVAITPDEAGDAWRQGRLARQVNRPSPLWRNPRKKTG